MDISKNQSRSTGGKSALDEINKQTNKQDLFTVTEESNKQITKKINKPLA